MVRLPALHRRWYAGAHLTSPPSLTHSFIHGGRLFYLKFNGEGAGDVVHMKTTVAERLPHYVTVHVRVSADLQLGRVSKIDACSRICDFMR